MDLKRFSALVLLTLIGIFVLAPVFSTSVHAADPKSAGFQLLPKCDPTKFVKDGESMSDADSQGACGFNAFQRLLVNIIKWLLYIMIPIGFCIVGWAGFRILTSAGNSERISEAYGMIKIVVIGVLIAALSYIIIVNVFNVLNIKANFSTLT